MSSVVCPRSQGAMHLHTCGCVGIHVGACRYMWVRVDTCGCMRIHVGACGHTCGHVRIHVGVWGPTRGLCRLHVGTCAYMWACVDACGWVCIYVGACGYMWVRVHTCGHVRIHVGACTQVGLRPRSQALPPRAPCAAPRSLVPKGCLAAQLCAQGSCALWHRCILGTEWTLGLGRRGQCGLGSASL